MLWSAMPPRTTPNFVGDVTNNEVKRGERANSVVNVFFFTIGKLGSKTRSQSFPRQNRLKIDLETNRFRIQSKVGLADFKVEIHMSGRHGRPVNRQVALSSFGPYLTDSGGLAWPALVVGSSG